MLFLVSSANSTKGKRQYQISSGVSLIIHFGGPGTLFVSGGVRQKPLDYPKKAHFAFLACEQNHLFAAQKQCLEPLFIVSS